MQVKYLSSLREKLREIMDRPSTRDLMEDIEALICELMEKHNPQSIVIAGSIAKSRFIRGLSDIDILVITDEPPSKESRFMLKAARDVNIEITVYSMSEVMDNIKAKNQFLMDALASGIEVHGDLLKKLRAMLKKD